jgi:hypothetical protein
MRSKLKNKKRWGPKKTVPNLYTRSVRLSAKAGEGLGEKEKEKNEGLDYLFIYSAGHHGRHF